MIEFEIDGKKIQADDGATIIEAADANGIHIPRFCYHKNLSIAANCRMCLVDVEKSGKPLPACATPVTAEMKVFTQSQKAIDAQRAVMEFLLINHPLDCPICDQGGECELQDVSMGYGTPKSYFTQGKRAVFSDDLGSLIETAMTRCIHCTRCVRFGEEVAGLRELGATYRGEHMHIGTYVKHFVRSELSGNVIDLCPVGALTNKPALYTERSWELQEHPMIAPHDCVGSHLYIHTRGKQNIPQRNVMRAVPRECLDINETWISDRDRFSCHALAHSDRLLSPRIKLNGQWQEVDWRQALDKIVTAMRNAASQHGSDKLAAVASPNCTVEEAYLLQKLFRAMGSSHVDHRIHWSDFADSGDIEGFPGINLSLAEIETSDCVVLIGSHVRYEQPLLNHRISKAVQNDGKVCVVNPIDYPFTYPIEQKLISGDLVFALAQVAHAIAQKTGQTCAGVTAVPVSQEAQAIADKLLAAQNPTVFMGGYALEHHRSSTLRALMAFIMQHTKARGGLLTHGANSAGAWLAGLLPHRAAGNKQTEAGHHACEILTRHKSEVLFLWNVEPEYDVAYAGEALVHLKTLPVVVCATSFVTPDMLDYADVLLPIAPFTESEGTYINVAGQKQSFSAATVPFGLARPGWKVLRVLATLLDLPGFEYKHTKQVMAELDCLLQQNDTPALQVRAITDAVSPEQSQDCYRVDSAPIYCVDPLVRRVEALQQAMEVNQTEIRMNITTAKRLQLREGQTVRVEQGPSFINVPINIDDRVADNLVVVPRGIKLTKGFGGLLPVVRVGGVA